VATWNDPQVPANVQRVGEITTFTGTGAGHVTLKAIPTSIGAYRLTHLCALVNNQAANARLFEIRNSHASNLILLTRLYVQWLQTGAHTAAIEDSLDLYKLTAFTTTSTTNTVTPGGSIKRAGMQAFPGNAAVIRGVTAAGAAAGMTGGNGTKDGSALGHCPQWLLAAVPTAAQVVARDREYIGLDSRVHSLMLGNGEGILLENRVLLGAAAASSVYIDCEFTEVVNA